MHQKSSTVKQHIKSYTQVNMSTWTPEIRTEPLTYKPILGLLKLFAPLNLGPKTL